MSKERPIHFIDSEYRELFTVPDGGSITITYPPGDSRGTITRPCRYLDEAHFSVGNNVYHRCEFAERMEAIGARYEPTEQIRGVEISPFTPGEERLYSYNKSDEDACVGHLAGDFGNQGDRFNTIFRNRQTGEYGDWSGAAAERQGETYSMVYALRGQMLKDDATMRSYCQSNPDAILNQGENFSRYGFQTETPSGRYFVSCFIGEMPREDRFMVYVYEKQGRELAKDTPSLMDKMRKDQQSLRQKTPDRAKPSRAASQRE